MAIPYGPTEKQGLSEKELLKVIALGQANVIRAIGMAEENAESRSYERGNFWNAGHFDELAQNIEAAVSPEDADPAVPEEIQPDRTQRLSIEDVSFYLVLVFCVGGYFLWILSGHI